MEITAALLADAASVEGGKLFVHGGAWDRIMVSELPAVHPTLALVLVFKIPYDEALVDHEISLQLLDEDDGEVGPAVRGVINVGHAPRSTRGAPTHVPQAITFRGIEFESAGRYRFRVQDVGSGSELASVPFEVTRPHA